MSFDCDICLTPLDEYPGLDIHPTLLSKREDAPEVPEARAQPTRGKKRKAWNCGKASCVPCVSAKKFKELSSLVSYTCGHLFHYYCVETWFMEKEIRSCPKCNKTCFLRARRRIYISKNDPGFKSKNEAPEPPVVAPAQIDFDENAQNVN